MTAEFTDDQRHALGQAILQDSLRSEPDVWKGAYRVLLGAVNNTRNTVDSDRALSHLMLSAAQIEQAVRTVTEETP